MVKVMQVRLEDKEKDRVVRVLKRKDFKKVNVIYVVGVINGQK